MDRRILPMELRCQINANVANYRSNFNAAAERAGDEEQGNVNREV
jgi:hypothetical protein